MKLGMSLAACVLLMSAGGQASAAPAYSVIGLGTLGGTESRAFGINDRGQVVGRAGVTTGSACYRAFLYADGAMTDLGALGGGWSAAYDINNRGQVVGWAETSSRHNHAFVYSRGTMVDLQPLGASTSSATGINDRGQVVGEADQRAFLWAAGTAIDLGTLGGAWADAQGINTTGQIVGGADIADGTRHPFLYQDGRMTDLGTLGDYGVGSCINDAGQVVGWYFPGERSFLLSGGAMGDIGTLGGSLSRAVAMNNAGHVVGWSTLSPGSDARHAFLYRNGTMHDLNALIPPDSGWVLFEAHDINDAGRIVGTGVIDGQIHAFLMIPEPATLCLLALGALAATRRRCVGGGIHGDE